MNARELRLWHWRRAMSARETANKYPDPGKNAFERNHRKNAERIVNFHIGAVQVLNDLCPIDITAEHDDRTMPRPHSRRQKRTC